MRQIEAKNITKTIAEMCIEVSCVIGVDILAAFKKSLAKEVSPLGSEVLKTLIKNSEVAKEKMIPICQDTGLTVVFVRMGQEVQIVGGFIEEAINLGVAQGYEEGFLRKSVVNDPIERINTKNNTPAVVHYQIVPGDEFSLTVAPKGFGSENMSALKMLKPSQGLAGVKEFIIKTVKEAGPNPCPPIIVGVGIGGSFEKSALMAKESLLRSVGSLNSFPFWAKVEQELLEEINGLNIGPMGFGGQTTALAVHINTFATHIAGLPVAVNMGCHVTRHITKTL